jgi:hypothetical protein
MEWAVQSIINIYSVFRYICTDTEFVIYGFGGPSEKNVGPH